MSRPSVGEEPEAGVLYVVPTPLGHLGDLSPRAAHILRSVDTVLAEDTRVSRKLLSHLGAHPELLSCHDHNEQARAGALVDWLAEGRRVALVSDAGTPLVSDPGFRVVQAVIAAGHRVCALPGPVAATTALCASGLPPDRFLFAGFLPKKASARRDVLAGLAPETATLLFYVSCHDLKKVLADMETVLGNRPCSASRDLSKRGEQHWRGPLAAVRADLAELGRITGEWTVVVGGAPEVVEARDAGLAPPLERLVARLHAAGLGARAIRDIVAEHGGVSKKLVYQAVLDLDR